MSGLVLLNVGSKLLFKYGGHVARIGEIRSA